MIFSIGDMKRIGIKLLTVFAVLCVAGAHGAEAPAAKPTVETLQTQVAALEEKVSEIRSLVESGQKQQSETASETRSRLEQAIAHAAAQNDKTAMAQAKEVEDKIEDRIKSVNLRLNDMSLTVSGRLRDLFTTMAGMFVVVFIVGLVVVRRGRQVPHQVPAETPLPIPTLPAGLLKDLKAAAESHPELAALLSKHGVK